LCRSYRHELERAPVVGLCAQGDENIKRLLFWQWTPTGEEWFESGLPLVDLSRIACYDILVAPLGLGALLCILRAHSVGNAGRSNQ
jgi:hypothetical protein